MGDSAPMRRLVLVLAWLAVVLAALVLALRTWGLGAVQTWERIGAFGNAGLSACAFVGAVFLWHRFTVRGEVYALWGAFGLLLLAAAHSVLPLHTAAHLIDAEQILPIGRALRAAAALLLVPYAARELGRVRPKRGQG